MNARFLVGDVFEQLATLPDDSVDLVFTSPPFLALRAYLPADHPDKGKEIGSEATPADFLDRLLDVVEACDRVLAPHGSLVFELGDTYAGSGGAGGDYDDKGLRGGQPKFSGSAGRRRPRTVVPNPTVDGIDFNGAMRHEDADIPKRGAGWPLDKSLTCIPALFEGSLAYGRNMLRPERATPRWRIRNLVPWCRPNPPVGALGDKWRPATSYVTVACKSRARWFDLDAVRGPVQDERSTPGVRDAEGPGGAPPLDFIVLPTVPYKGAHYATFPPALVVPFVESMCPREVCQKCGEARQRIIGEASYTRDGETIEKISEWPWGGDTIGKSRVGRSDDYRLTRQAPTLGWTDCGHADFRPGVVLDPFAGSGTTLMVATGHGRDAVGIDIDERNLALAQERLGMFLEPA